MKLMLKPSLLIILSLFTGVHLSQGQDLLEDSSFFQAFKYRNIGPTRGGRVTSVAGISSKPSTYFMGSSGGGLWKTEDYGNNWENVSDGFFNTPSIGAIRVAPSDPKTVYAGTGSDGLRSNVITGKGIYKSVNGGKKWTSIGLEKTGHIGAVEVHPEDKNIVFVAAIGNAFAPNSERGIYRSQDGGDNWEKVLFLSDTVGFSDLEFAPDDPNIIYAGAWRAERKPWTIISGGMEGGIYKSVDGGDNWTQQKNGLPQGIIGKIDLAVSPAAPEMVFALVEAPDTLGGLYISKDRGESFEQVSHKKELMDRPFYYCNVDVNPQNPRSIYVSATQYWHSTDGGKKWKRVRTPHGDNHDMWMNPSDTLIFVQANDGGANVTLNGGKSWSTQQNQSTAELYQVEVDDQYPYWLYAGQQDNSTIAVPSRPPHSSPSGGTGYWISVGGCETGPVVPKPGDHNIVYANCKGRFGVYDKRTGQEKQYYVGAANMYGHNPKDLKYRFQRVSPIHVSPHNPDKVYHTSQYVHATTDDGQTWNTISPDLTAFEPDQQVISGYPITRDVTGEEFYSTIYAIRESPVKEGIIWTGANDGPVHVTPDGGKNWNNVTPESLLPGGRVDAVEPSPHKAEKAYFSVLRYQLGDWKPYIFKTTDLGNSWELLTDGKNGIPADYPVRVVREDPNREGLLYAGTEFGLFVSLDDGENWLPFQQNLPVTPVTDIKVFRKDLLVSTMGRGFWVLDDLSPLYHTLNMESPALLFPPIDVYAWRYRPSGGVPQFPSVAANIDYYLEEGVESEVRLEIKNSSGKLIRGYTSEVLSKDSTESGEADMATGFLEEGFSPGLKKSKGMHRFKWDLRHSGSWDKEVSRRGSSGPRVIPGKYSINLLIGEKILTRELLVKADPRIIESGLTQDDLKAQEELVLKVRNLISLGKKLNNNIQEYLKNFEGKENSSRHKEILEINSGLNTAEGRYMTPGLMAQLSYLYSMLMRADQRPGKDAYERFDELKEKLDQLITKSKDLSQGLDEILKE